MYCTFCGKQIEDDDVFCPHCGRPIPQDNALAKLVAAARTGDQDAIGALYEKTYSKVYYTVKSMIKDEDTVFDIVQDTYIKAFAHLDSFQGDTKFLPWVRQIAANTARDWLKKKRPMLFVELNANDEQDTPVEELFPDERSENLPDQVIEQEETKRLIREIINDLPEDQRVAIGMFYYEEMSVKEIAAAMDASESAVKSRLKYGRDKIEKKVLELEKQGTKLYSLAPLPFLLLLFRNLQIYGIETPDNRILRAILALQPVGAATAAEAIGNTGSTGGTASHAGNAGTAGMTDAAIGTAGIAGTAATVGSLGALKIGLIILITVTVVSLGAFGGIQIAAHLAESQKTITTEDDIDQEELGIPGGSEAPERTETPKESKTPEESNPIDEALEQYRTIIRQADTYEYNKDIPDLETQGYWYALVQMQPEDPVPTLLLKKEEGGWTFVTTIRVFQYDVGTKTLYQPAETLGSGIRGGLSMAGDGNGILNTEWSGGTGKGSVTRITLDGDSLKYDTCWTGRIDLMPDSLTFIEIQWHEIEDLSALDNWTAPDPNGEPSSESLDSSVLPTDGDRIVLTGTVGTYNYDDIISLQGRPDPNDFDERAVEYAQSRTYHVIVLDTPQTLRLRSFDPSEGDNYTIHEALMINIEGTDNMNQYEGQHITFSIDPDATWWPTDTSLPLGQPSTGDIHVLE